MSTPSADQLYRQGMDLLPGWNDEGPDADARFEAALVVITQAAEAGSLEGADYLAMGASTHAERMRWCRVLADTGDFGALTSHLTDGDRPEVGAEVLAAARAGEAWAMTALGYVYAMGMVNGDGVDMATVEGSYGWLPAVADPAAEARRWTELAAATGFVPARMRMLDRFGLDTAAEALAEVQVVLADPRLHPAIRDRAEARLTELLEIVGADPADQVAEHERQAADGNPAAMVWLADRLVAGAPGVVTDPARARGLYAQAADAGEVAAMRELGRMCEEGLGGPVDLEAARSHYEQAAELGADRFARTRLVERWGLGWYALGPDEQG